jgi:DnaJ-class molecular chaperone
VEHACTSCHGDAHSIFPKNDPRSAVYPLNIPRTCGSCHGSETMAKKFGLPNVYPLYMDSIHGFALSSEGLLVAANCQSCHGSHHILSHKDPHSQDVRKLPREDRR